MSVQSPQQKQQLLEDVLNRIVTAGEYEAALLSDTDGLVLAMAAADEMAVMMAAITALLRDAATQARQQLSLANINELSLVGDDRFRVVCRFFQTGMGQPLSLTLVVPPDQAYRRITNQAIADIVKIWSQ
jgi:predicted regulator of Ras-like GTPase activity (Roadblock/LC7/MglB family)